MTSLGQKMARELTAQFYRWELRGRGWIAWPDAVPLEPPFRPFEGHYLPRQFVQDDGQIESLGSLFAKGVGRMFGFGGTRALPPPEEIEEPLPGALDTAGDLVELQIALPPDYQPHANVFEQFLFSIGYARESVAFEVIGTSEELVVQLTTSPKDAGMVRQQLKAFFPEAVIVAEQRHLLDGLLIQGAAAEVMDFGLEREFMVPINNLKGNPGSVMAARC